jgi:tripartite-type tricarboxylate transporter receptor subunit TctC
MSFNRRQNLGTLSAAIATVALTSVVGKNFPQRRLVVLFAACGSTDVARIVAAESSKTLGQ